MRRFESMRSRPSSSRAKQLRGALQNAARASEHAFGVSYADGSVGLYGEDDVRGFSPIDTGNIRSVVVH